MSPLKGWGSLGLGSAIEFKLRGLAGRVSGLGFLVPGFRGLGFRV